MLVRNSLIMSIALLASIHTGCCCGPGVGGCGPGGCGPLQGSCNNCDDAGFGGMPMACGPLDALVQLKKSIVCGGGCGETYCDEWVSTPPDACDPCCGSQFVGGARPCVPFCWRPGMFLGCFSGLYGKRFCNGCGNGASQCECGFNSGCGCGSCGNATCGGNCGDGNCGSSNFGGSNIGGSVPSGGGCSTCNANQSTSNRIASPPDFDPNHRTARANTMGRSMSSGRGMNSSYSGQNTQYR